MQLTAISSRGMQHLFSIVSMGKKAQWISHYGFLGDRLNSEYFPPKNNVQMQKYNWLLSYLCASANWVFLCLFHFRQFEDEKASLAMVDKAKPVIDTGNASFAFLFEKVSLDSTLLAVLLHFSYCSYLLHCPCQNWVKLFNGQNDPQFKKCSFY